MKLSYRSALAGVTSVMLGVGMAGTAIGQDGTLQKQIVGTWSLTTIYDEFAGGKKENPWGPGVKGSAMYDSGGRFSYMIISAGRAKAETGPRTPVGQAIGYFGTYTVNEADKSVTWKIERATFPNWEGIERKGSMTIKGDQMMQVSSPVPTPTGSFVPNIEWKRAK